MVNNCSVHLWIKNAFNTLVFYTKILIKTLRSSENKFKILIEKFKKEYIKLNSLHSEIISINKVGLAGVGWRGGEKMQTTVIEQQ